MLNRAARVAARVALSIAPIGGAQGLGRHATIAAGPGNSLSWWGRRMTSREAYWSIFRAVLIGALGGLLVFVAVAATVHTMRSHHANETEWRNG